MTTTMTLRALLASAVLATSLNVLAEGPVSPGFAQAKPETKAQHAMLKVVQRWHDTYNTDVAKMIAETYAPDADVYFTGASVKGHEAFTKLESAIKTAAPGRYMRIDHLYFSGNDRAIVEAVILDTAKPDFYSPWMAILQIKDGKITHDRTYLEPARWPGIEATKGLVTLGGLGAP